MHAGQYRIYIAAMVMSYIFFFVRLFYQMHYMKLHQSYSLLRAMSKHMRRTFYITHHATTHSSSADDGASTRWTRTPHAQKTHAHIASAERTCVRACAFASGAQVARRIAITSIRLPGHQHGELCDDSGHRRSNTGCSILY